MSGQLTSYWNLHRIPILMIVASLAFYFAFAYDLQRTDFIKLLSLFTALFFFCFKIIQFEKWNFKFLLFAGIVFRLAFLFSEPNLSQDFYRFIWDGELVAQGLNPYLFPPDDLILRSDIVLANAQQLHEGMGSLSARHFSNYPPLNQLLFALSVLLGGKTIMGSVVAMRILILLADVGIVYYGRKLLKYLNRSPHLIFWYFLNPLVVIELSGNLHFEGLMLFFFVLSLYLLSQKKWAWAATVYALSISIKLIPILFLPLFLRHFGFKKSVPFYVLVAGVCILTFLPFYSPHFLDNYLETVGLWFSNFEFNAGLYNIVEQIAIQFDAKPWEFIKTYGSITPLIIIGAVLLFTFLRKNEKLSILITSMLGILTLYYFLASTVHPWYVIFLVLLTLYSDFRYPLFWSAVVIFSYSAYSNPYYSENLWLIATEYIVVFGFLIYEIAKIKGYKLVFFKK